MKNRELLEKISELVSEGCSCDGHHNEGSSLGEGEVGEDFRLRDAKGLLAIESPLVHKSKDSVICATDARGHSSPGGRNPTEIVLDASQGFIPLWAPHQTLRWRFNEPSMQVFRNPSTAKDGIRRLLLEGVMLWGGAAPVRFHESSDFWDFELYMYPRDDCRGGGCVLASAFFPDSGRHRLNLYPQMFRQSSKEQVDTMAHEIGHIFGLRHFFAQVSEAAWPSEVFGEHRPFSIMNYGAQSEMTDTDRSDLKNLYDFVWSGHLSQINRTPIRLFEPYHQSGQSVWPQKLVAFAK